MGGIINIFASVSLSGAPFETVTVEEGMFILTQELVQGKGPCETITITTHPQEVIVMLYQCQNQIMFWDFPF